MPDATKPSKRCPECGQDLEGRNPEAHANLHWPPEIPDKDLGQDAVKRRKILREMK